MGAHTTINISRQKAIEYIIKELFSISDADLSDILDIFLYDRLYNTRIVHDAYNEDHILDD